MHARIAILVASFFTAAAGLAADPLVGRRLPSFSTEVLDLAGGKPRPSVFESDKATRPTVYIMVGTRCPATGDYAGRFAALQREYAARGVDFIYVYANREDTKEEKIAFHRAKDLGGRLVADGGGEIARRLGATRTTEVFLADAQGTIVFHGGIDDSRSAAGVKQQFLKMALDATLAGQPVAVTSAQVFA